MSSSSSSLPSLPFPCPCKSTDLACVIKYWQNGSALAGVMKWSDGLAGRAVRAAHT